MQQTTDFEFNDLQALLRFGHGRLTDTCFILLKIIDSDAAKSWLTTAPVSRAVASQPPPDTALQIAFSVEGLRALGLAESVIEEFSEEFISGMAGDESRSRRLGDVGSNAPRHWQWGGTPDQVPHALLLLYATQGGLEAWKEAVLGDALFRAFEVVTVLPTLDIGSIEPFGFADGISQPKIDWTGRQRTDLHERDRYSNLLAAGEIVLGYPNEYGQYTARPLIDANTDRFAVTLPNAQDVPALKDFGRNGSYLVIRQLNQDVPGFWRFVDQASGAVPEQREALAAKMVGRQRDGTPLVPRAKDSIPGIAVDDHANHFTYEPDPKGHGCPIGAHIRRANPRTGDFTSGVFGTIDRLIRMFGFGLKREDEDLIASARFHRLLRRGRTYGSLLSPEEALKPDAPADARGLQFICLVGNISRQFEFVQNAWLMSSKFAGAQQERDPLVGIREPLFGGDLTDRFNQPDPGGPARQTCGLPQFVTVHGGGYFFMPGLRALQYLAALP